MNDRIVIKPCAACLYTLLRYSRFRHELFKKRSAKQFTPRPGRLPSRSRRGRLPLISSLFEPGLTDSNHRLLGRIIDVFAVLVTLFGTATSLGISTRRIPTRTSRAVRMRRSCEAPRRRGSKVTRVLLSPHDLRCFPRPRPLVPPPRRARRAHGSSRPPLSSPGS
ncbi:BCCT family transporter [Corynebacterium phoceense]|uniref:BCCT family transporter n=1 Tax=Corynebacterium phoceense TaxID=1686286 RepID=UPI001D2AEB70|nr:BCCT family transporter [Corynebacterium phoceense]HJG43750.1 BCCT family transporter [Corynebacterium phoceense]